MAKHAAASRVGVTLSYMEDVVTLDVRDDGVGFDPAGLPEEVADGSGFGLTGDAAAGRAGSPAGWRSSPSRARAPRSRRPCPAIPA